MGGLKVRFKFLFPVLGSLGETQLITITPIPIRTELPMTGHLSASARFTFFGALSLLWLFLPLSVQRRAPASEIEKGLRLTRDILAQGLRLVPRALTLVNVEKLDLRFVDVNVQLQNEAVEIARRQAEITERLGQEQNEVLRRQLGVLKSKLQADKERNDLLRMQSKTLQTIADYQVRSVEYRVAQDSSLLRKLTYDVPANKLVVVVADFSCGSLDMGREVADEIAHQLTELTRHGVDIHVLSGEIKPGVVIRSEHMAQDIGTAFPPGTNYAVIWGTMSPRTVGRYRPHITCVQKTGSDKGVSVSIALELESADLPLKDEAADYQRECYKRLIGVTCAAIPLCYAAHEISHERTPQFDRLYKFLGEDTEEVTRLKRELEPLTVWTRSRASHRLGFLRRLSQISLTTPFPKTILNEKDDSLMVLITDADGRPHRFPSKQPGKEEIVYIDATETTNRQFLRFLAEVGNKDEGGAKWIKLDPDPKDESLRDIEYDEKKNLYAVRWKQFLSAPVFDVNWFGAKAYCQWAGKHLPRKEAWQWAAGSSVDGGEYPWGKGFERPEVLCNSANDDRRRLTAPCGEFRKDRSRIGCFDMAGNVAEWCEDYYDSGPSKRLVCGGSYDDKEAHWFKSSATRGVDQVVHRRWIGFRGVIRIPVDK